MSLSYAELRAERDRQKPGGCPEWATRRSAVSARFDDTYRCNRPVKAEVLMGPYSQPEWVAVCGIHARQYVHRRPLSAEGAESR
jgi:hypothetical protein